MAVSVVLAATRLESWLVLILLALLWWWVTKDGRNP
jgi:hypothetical protein